MHLAEGHRSVASCLPHANPCGEGRKYGHEADKERETFERVELIAVSG